MEINTLQMNRIVRFWCALLVGMYFYTKIDILIWQRIFEANKLWNLGNGIYHYGWIQALYGFMVLGFILFYPHVRQMITFPLSLAILAFSGMEDILYYWLDGKHIPPLLPWLNPNPLILKPVTENRLIISAVFWFLFVVALNVAGEYFEYRLRAWRKKTQAEKLNSKEAPSIPTVVNPLDWVETSALANTPEQ